MAPAMKQPHGTQLAAAFGGLTVACLLLSSCGALPGGILSSPGPSPYPFPTSAPSLRLPVNFLVHVPGGTSSGAQVVLNILDEVTGLSLNTQVYPMQSLDSSTWQVQVGLPEGDLVFYRYSLRTTSEFPEALATGAQLDYRVYYVGGPGQVEDQISSWVGAPLQGMTGMIRGLVRDATTGLAVPGMVVTVAGQRTFTDSSGSYSLEGVPVGKHMLVAFDPDEGYRPYEQEAIVANGEETPANLVLVPSPRVSVTFHIFLPTGTPPGAPVRLIGNLLALGNTFEPGPAGSMIEPTRAPALTALPDGSSVVVLSLPVGFHLRYKVTLGDGFWNAEHTQNGVMVVRELDVPSRDLLVNVGVVSWGSNPQEAVTFNLGVPPGLPATDWVAIQFSPFPGIWMEPLPMWPLGAQHWTYALFSPFGWPGNIAYRYCRNGDCGVADDAATAGPNPKGRQLAPAPLPQTLEDTVQSWVAWSGAPMAPLAPPPISARPDFRAGVVLSPGNWPPPYEPTLVDLVSLHPQWLLLSPSWYLGSANPLPEIEYLPQDGSSLRQELLTQIATARAAGLQVGLAPALQPTSGTLGAWWASGDKGLDWWNAWFSAYRDFLVSYADLAQEAGVQELVVARAEVLPALPGTAGASPDADTRWRVLIRDIRTHFSGRIGIELLLTDHLQAVPTFLDEVDDIYIQVRTPLASGDSASISDMTSVAGSVIDNNLSALRATAKPLLLEAAFASANGGASGCARDSAGHCLALETLNPGSPLALATPVNLDLQAHAVQSLLAAAASRNWIGGFLTWDYYPVVGLQDASASVHGKPAEAVLSAYFQALR
ncbi:MAG: carboxypeptidase regulatory-like domain-containing protein [Anaerolineales bacterium]